jgi:hypothetical protein
MLSKKELRSRANSDSCLRGGCVSAWKGPRTRIHSGFHQVRVTEIPRLNHAFRTTFRGGRILLTASVAELPEMVKAAALHQVSAFTDFKEGNDPHEEHDFIKFEVCNRDFIFSIIYYD